MAKNKNNFQEEITIEKIQLPEREKNQMFGYIVEKTGGGKLRVMCEDKKIRMARIPKKLKKMKWRMFFNIGDYVIIQLQEVRPEEYCDVIYKYRDIEVEKLKEAGILPELEKEIPDIYLF
jgi:initiation factor 1A